jgi:hypothetical protein
MRMRAFSEDESAAGWAEIRQAEPGDADRNAHGDFI